MNIARIPITNTIVGGDYTAQIELGAAKHIANVLLDTGSSTLAVWRNSFGNTPTTATPYVQFVGYGTGSWAGPVVMAQVGMGTGAHYIDLPSTTIAQIRSGQYQGQPQFYPANGILGLAYANLNQAAKVGPNFPLSRYNTPQAWARLQPFVDLDPWFTDLVKAQQVANKFAFLTKRSFVDYSTSNPATDPLNQGWFILGGGEEQTDLYNVANGFTSVAVVADLYYNTNLLSVQVGNQAAFAVDPDAADAPYDGSNSIVDSGTNSIVFSPPIYGQMMQNFYAINPNFVDLINGNPPELTMADLVNWPTINLTLQGSDGNGVTLQIKPNNYWQINATPGGQAYFAIESGQSLQSILGLPLMNNYYVIFDRSADNGEGVIKFANQA